MNPIPPQLIEGFPEVAREEIEAWWFSLTAERQSQVQRLFDEREDKCVFGIIGSEDADVEIEHGQFMPGADEPDEGEAWQQDRYEYLVNHPELIIAWDMRSTKISTSVPHM